jgi:hypothetical protein
MTTYVKIFTCVLVFLLTVIAGLVWQVANDVHALRQEFAPIVEPVNPAVDFRPHRVKEQELTLL